MTLEEQRQTHVCSLVCESSPAPFMISYIELVKAYEIIFLDLSDVIVLEVDDHCVFSDLLGNGDLPCCGKRPILVVNNADVSVR